MQPTSPPTPTTYEQITERPLIQGTAGDWLTKGVFAVCEQIKTAASPTKEHAICGETSFLREHKRRPSASQDGIAAWLRDEIEWHENTDLTEHGKGALSAFRQALRELETVNG